MILMKGSGFPEPFIYFGVGMSLNKKQNRRSLNGVLYLCLSGFLALSCKPAGVPSAPSAGGMGTLLSAGDAAILGFTTHGTQNDQFAFVILKNVAAGTRLNISDMNWDGSEFSLSDGGVIVWTADRDYPAGTIVQALDTANGGASSTHSYAVNVYSGGETFTNVTGGSQSAGYTFNSSSPVQVTTVANTGGGLTGLAAGGDQLILYQGSTVLGAAASGITFVGAFNYGAAWLTGSPVPADATGADSYLPPGLADGQNAVAVTLPYDNGGYYNCSNGTMGNEAALGALLNNQANWVLSMGPSDLPVPVVSCGITGQ